MMSIKINNPIVDFSHFTSTMRNEGLSGFIRARNEGKFLAEAIESWLPLLDELIIVYNNCQDNTADIVDKYILKYPNKVRGFHYVPIVYPQGSDMYKTLGVASPHSLVNYYNFALSKTTKKWAVKIDGDLILVPEIIDILREKYFELSSSNPDAYLPISGINIILQKNQFYVPSGSPFCGTNGDLCMFRVDNDTIFKKSEETEYLELSKRHKLDNLFAYYHLKFVKSDYGIGNYEFHLNPNSRYLPKTLFFLLFTRLIPLEKIGRGGG